MYNIGRNVRSLILVETAKNSMAFYSQELILFGILTKTLQNVCGTVLIFAYLV